MAPRSKSYGSSRTLIIVGVVALFLFAAFIGLFLSLGNDVADDDPEGGLGASAFALVSAAR